MRTAIFLFGFFFGITTSFAQEGAIFGTTTLRSPQSGYAMSVPETSLIYQPAPQEKTFKKHDIIKVHIKDISKYSNVANNQRKKNIKAISKVTSFFRFDGLFNLPSSLDEDKLPEIGGQIDIKYQNNGSLIRNETLSMTISCTVNTVHPNGNLNIEGYDWKRVGEESKRIYVSGMVRPEDIDGNNIVQSDDMAGKIIYEQPEGQIYDTVRRGWGTRWLEHWSPF